MGTEGLILRSESERAVLAPVLEDRILARGHLKAIKGSPSGVLSDLLGVRPLDQLDQLDAGVRGLQ
ncbi:hypothetical protein GCM10009677_18560 [Sphaerisporangium rubeum]